MKTRQAWHWAAVLLLMALAGASSQARADEVPLVTGEHWTRSSEQVKKSYLIGVANVIQIESAYHAGNAPPDSQSIIPRTVRGLKGQSLDSVRSALDNWYATHPDRLQRPVIETLWFEMIVPGLNSKP